MKKTILFLLTTFISYSGKSQCEIGTTDTTYIMCYGDSVQIQTYLLNGFGNTWEIDSALYLPDGSGQNYSYPMNFTSYANGAVLLDTNDFELCLNIEHSYLGDLEAILVNPEKDTLVLFDSYNGNGSAELVTGGFGGGGTFLGQPMDNNIGNPGVARMYCFSASNYTVGTMAQEYSMGSTIPVSSPSPGNSMDWNNVYRFESSLAAFQGDTINGLWEIIVRDNLSIDDGYIFGFTFNLGNDTLISSTSASYSQIDFLSNPILLNPWAFPDSTVTFDQYLYDSVAMCYDTNTITINVIDLESNYPSATILGDNFANVGQNKWYTPSGLGSGNYSWECIGCVISDSSAVADSVEVGFSNSGTNFLILHYAENGCSVQDTLEILANPLNIDEFINEFKLYPNPTEGLINISGKLNSYMVYDQSGRLVHTGNTNQINLRSFPKGIYFISIQHSQGRSNHRILLE